jgi:hypothetical protein
MLAFWMGGACSGAFIPVPPVPVPPDVFRVASGGPGYAVGHDIPERITDDDFLELLTLIVPLLCKCK